MRMRHSMPEGAGRVQLEKDFLGWRVAIYAPLRKEDASRAASFCHIGVALAHPPAPSNESRASFERLREGEQECASQERSAKHPSPIDSFPPNR